MRKFYLFIGVEIVIVVIVALLFSSCESGEFRSSDSGLQYKIVDKGDGEKPENGEVMLLEIAYSDAAGNELFSTPGGNPVPMMYSEGIDTINGGIEESIRMMKVGDSLVCKFPAENLFEKTFNGEVPPSIERGSLLTMNIRMVDAMSEEEFNTYQEELGMRLRAEQEAKAEEQLQEDIRIMNEYFNNNGIDPQVHESGIRYVVHEEGNGNYPTQGQNVKVHYAGRFLDGDLFDTSIKSVAEENGVYNPSREPYDPFVFPIGTGRVIQGWDVGIGLLDEGASATLYIPSGMAYGPSSNARIPANSILKFDVELVEIVGD